MRTAPLLLLTGCLVGEAYVPQPVSNTNGWFPGGSTTGTPAGTPAGTTGGTPTGTPGGTPTDSGTTPTGTTPAGSTPVGSTTTWTTVTIPLPCTQANATGCSEPSPTVYQPEIDLTNNLAEDLDVHLIDGNCVDNVVATIPAGGGILAAVEGCEVYRMVGATSGTEFAFFVVDEPIETVVIP